MAQVKVTQIKSVIERKFDQKLTIKALGLGRPNYFNVLPDNPQTWGMVNKVKHLVVTEMIND